MPALAPAANCLSSLEIGSPLAIVHSGSGILPGHARCRGRRDHHPSAGCRTRSI